MGEWAGCRHKNFVEARLAPTIKIFFYFNSKTKFLIKQ
jgi:hypothetical protein